MDQEWDLSIQMTDRYTLGPLGEMTSNQLAEYYVYVIYDLACSLLLVDTLAKLMLVTPRGSIYARQWVQSPFNLGE